MAVFSFREANMNIYIYSDESGVFDYVHNQFYVYGGLILLGKEEKDYCERKFKNAEHSISQRYKKGIELKASNISNSDRSKLFRSVNKFHKFGVVVREDQVLKEIYNQKKSKQRYLDFAYKIGLKHALEAMIYKGALMANDVQNVYVFVDEHTTATDGRYELQEGLIQEFKEGTFNYKYDKFFPPIFPLMNSLTVQYCNSAKRPLVRAADIIANRIYHHAMAKEPLAIRDNLYIKRLP